MKYCRLIVVVGSAVLALGSCAVAQVQKPAAGPHKARITASQAERVALHKYPGKIVGKVPLENEEGKWQYAVTVRSRTGLREIMVDANTGKIANVEVTNAAKERAEHKAETAKAKSGMHRAGTRKGEPAEKHEK